MGPVNLRADVEAEAVEKQIAGITAEREELTTAIAKLRGSIGHLNREGRERLGAMFEQIDRNFQALFTRMFGGGKAHLALVGSDDPLEAGLEIYAQPPGKKLATLSLLSGGEQALTALSLIFAVFRCNPGAGLRAGRGGRAAGRRQCRAVLHPDGGHGAGDRDALPGGDAPSADHGADGPAVWRDDAGARRVAAAVGRSDSAQRRWPSRRGWRRNEAGNNSGCGGRSGRPKVAAWDSQPLA